MLRILRGCAALLVLAWPSVAGNVSYVVLHGKGSDGLIRVSGDGQSRATIAAGVVGSGLATDGRGDYIVATIGSLVRVTASGVVSNIAVCPSGSQWMSVAIDASGNFIAGDNRLHAIWRVTPDGQIVDKVAAYPVKTNNELEDVGVVVDNSGDFLVMEDNSFSAHFWRISPTGLVMPIPLLGDKMTAGAAIIPAGDGTYLAGSYRDRAVFRVTSDGLATKFASVDAMNLTGLARNPETGELVATFNFDHSLRKIGADGASIARLANLGYATAVIAESRR